MFDIQQPKKQKMEIIKNFFGDFFGRFKRKRDGRLVHKIVQYLLYVFSAGFLIICISFAAFPATLKYVYEQITKGRESLANTISIVNKENFRDSFEWANLANYNFNSALDKFKTLKDNFFVSNISTLNKEFTDVESLLSSTVTLSDAVKGATALGDKMENSLDGEKKLSFSKFSMEEKRRILEILDQSNGELEQVKLNMDISADHLQEIKYAAVLSLFKDNVLDFKSKVEDERDLFAKALPMLKAMPGAFGYPEQVRYLVLIKETSSEFARYEQVNNFFVLDIMYGEFLHCANYDIYSSAPASRANTFLSKDDKEWQTSEPGEYENIKEWFKKDGKFLPSWDTTGGKIEKFYKGFEKEFDGIISISPDMFKKFLALTGPVNIDDKPAADKKPADADQCSPVKPGLTYDKDNFIKLSGNVVKIGNKNLKQYNATMCPLMLALKIKLFDLPPAKWPAFIDVMHNGLENVGLDALVKDQKVQSLIKEQQEDTD